MISPGGECWVEVYAEKWRIVFRKDSLFTALWYFASKVGQDRGRKGNHRLAYSAQWHPELVCGKSYCLSLNSFHECTPNTPSTQRAEHKSVGYLLPSPHTFRFRYGKACWGQVFPPADIASPSESARLLRLLQREIGQNMLKKELQNWWFINCSSLVNCALSKLNLNLNPELNKISCRDEGMC